MSQQEMPIFVRTFDLLAWLLPATNRFPRAYRHSFTQRLLAAAFDLSEALQEANLRYAGHNRTNPGNDNRPVQSGSDSRFAAASTRLAARTGIMMSKRASSRESRLWIRNTNPHHS